MMVMLPTERRFAAEVWVMRDDGPSHFHEPRCRTQPIGSTFACSRTCSRACSRALRAICDVLPPPRPGPRLA